MKNYLSSFISSIFGTYNILTTPFSNTQIRIILLGWQIYITI